MSNHSVSRRKVVSSILQTGVAASVASVFVSFSANAQGDQLDEGDPTAMALGYMHDATAVDVEKYPRRAGEAGANMFCKTCVLYTGAEGEAWGPCSIFPGKMVAADGWCNSFAPKA